MRRSRVAGYGLDGLSGADAASGAVSFSGAVWTADPHSTGLLEVIGSGGFALAVIGLCLLACRTFLTWVVLPLRAVGAMPLTAYTVQLVVWAIVAATVLGDPGDLRGLPRPRAVLADDDRPSLLACTAWALLIGRGPLEWVVDRIARPTVRRR